MLISVIRPVPLQAIAFVKDHEGCRLTAYRDSASVLTIGYGHTGPDVQADTLGADHTITQTQADLLLASDLAHAAQRLEAAVGEDCIRELTQNQYSALISFVFNVGCDPKWAICQRLKAKDFDAVPSELMRFVNAGGKKLSGLVNRRADEVKLWSTSEPGSIPDDPSSSVTRAVDTPPTAASRDPLGKTAHWIAGCVTACVSTASAVAPQVKGGLDQASDAIAPYVGHSTILQGLADHLALAAAGLAVLTVGLTWLSHQKAKAS